MLGIHRQLSAKATSDIPCQDLDARFRNTEHLVEKHAHWVGYLGRGAYDQHFFVRIVVRMDHACFERHGPVAMGRDDFIHH